MDRATPLLNQAVCKGAVLGNVKVTLCANGQGKIVPLMVYQFDNAVISAISVGGGGGDKPVETLSINYTRITWTYSVQADDGSRQGDVTASWDLRSNQSA